MLMQLDKLTPLMSAACMPRHQYTRSVGGEALLVGMMCVSEPRMPGSLPDLFTDITCTGEGFRSSYCNLNFCRDHALSLLWPGPGT